ncbi:MAG: hypothetical protein ACK5LT_13125 [Lachnospirales bacterium]
MNNYEGNIYDDEKYDEVGASVCGINLSLCGVNIGACGVNADVCGGNPQIVEYCL